MASSFIHVPSFLSGTEYFIFWMHYTLFLHSPTEIILLDSQCCQLWIKLPKTSMCRFLCRHKFSALGKYQGPWLMSSMFSFVGNHPADFQSDCTILHSHQRYVKVAVVPHPCQCLVLCRCWLKYSIDVHYVQLIDSIVEFKFVLTDFLPAGSAHFC